MKIFRQKNKAFTIVELLIVVAILGILASLTIVAYGSWQNRVAKAEVESTLKMAGAAMDTERNFKNAYPTALPTTYKAATGVTVTYASGDNTAYCLTAVSKKNASIVMHIASTDQTPQEGACTVIVGAPGIPQFTSGSIVNA